MTQYIADEAHFKEVIARVPNVKKYLWIGTADIKDLYVGERPFLGILADLISKGREVRLIHAKEPGPNFREDFDHYPVLFTGLERVLCPRVHFKLIIFDLKLAYIGSANLTGAGLGMKSSRTQLRSRHSHRRARTGRSRHEPIRLRLGWFQMQRLRAEGVLFRS